MSINNKRNTNLENKIYKNDTELNEINNNKKNKLKIIHWNPNSIHNKTIELKNFIIDNLKPDIISLNETKLSTFRANMILNFNNYNTIHKARDNNKNFYSH